MKNKQSGNVLFMILIAIFLLGGLTVLMSRTSGTSDDTGGAEQVSIQASELFKYASGLQAAVQSLASQQGCSENEISFYYASEPFGSPADYTNPNSTASCEVFGAQGAGLTYKTIPAAWRTITGNYAARSHFASGQCVNGIGTGSGTTCSTATTELRFIALGLTKELCLAINNRLGITNPSGNPPEDEDYVAPFVGTYTPGNTGLTGVIGDDSTASAVPLKGKKAGCLMDTAGSTSGQYFFYHVLLAR